ncbi:hypothetical protein [Bacteroides caecimuris]|uniref:hypothetical protein n=1 Tax=Bacteroides caecimuris TaxID=1796613 RepID=UPI002573BA74|nr:hypothetical protein [Bacteroides caecimuris]
MNQFNYNQSDSRDDFSSFIGIFSPMMKPEDESVLRSISANLYSSDFGALMNVLNGKVFHSVMPSKTIDNAVEYYKQVNKALLIFRDLKEPEKLRESNEIDYEATRLKSDWYNKLYQMRIHII